ncbi:MAG: hypothetical protein ACE5R6_12865 [Candidatus Heimdallarchaeota archaeon]
MGKQDRNREEEVKTIVHPIFVFVGGIIFPLLMGLVVLGFLRHFWEPLSLPERIGYAILLSYIGLGIIVFILGGILKKQVRMILAGLLLSTIYLSYWAIRVFLNPLFVNFLGVLGLSESYIPVISGSLCALIYFLALILCWYGVVMLVAMIFPSEIVKTHRLAYSINAGLVLIYYLGYFSIVFLDFLDTHRRRSGLINPLDQFDQLLTLIMIVFILSPLFLLMDTIWLTGNGGPFKNLDEDVLSCSVCFALPSEFLSEIYWKPRTYPSTPKRGTLFRLIMTSLLGFISFFCILTGSFSL